MWKRRLTWLSAVTLVAAISLAGAQDAAAQPTPDSQSRTMNIRITIDGVSVSGKLEDNPSARDFASLLPLNVALEDYARTEKITYLPRKLSTTDAPAGIEPLVGDIAYYAPWGNLAIFYRDFGYSSGLIKLGTIEPSAIAVLSRLNSGQATIELVRD
jgi:hypothetical protein